MDGVLTISLHNLIAWPM